MKKAIYLLLALTQLFISCNKDEPEDTGNSENVTIMEDGKILADNIYFNKSGDSYNATLEVTGANSKSLTKLVIPGTLKISGKIYTVTSIYREAFFDHTELTSIELPNTLKTIGLNAFRGCTGLTSIELPETLETIELAAFWGCTGLTSIELPNSVTTIKDAYQSIYGTFSGCTGLTSVTLGNSLVNIGAYAFNGCTGLTKIKMPDSVTGIGEGAFGDCPGLTSVFVSV